MLETTSMKSAKVALLLLGVCSLTHAQPPVEAPAKESDAVFRSDARLVEVHATVTDRDGRLLTDLPESAFQIYENDAPQGIKVFRREDAPVSLGLIIDNSASMLVKRA